MVVDVKMVAGTFHGSLETEILHIPSFERGHLCPPPLDLGNQHSMVGGMVLNFRS